MIFGRFYYKKTISGNLLGEFSNNTSESNSTESADLILKSEDFKEENKGSFIGTYRGTWLEKNKSVECIIRIKAKTTHNIFSVTWESNGTIFFWGEGLIVDSIFVGNYWDRRVQEVLR